MNLLPVSLLAARARETATDARYYWDSRRRGKNLFSIFQYSWSGSGIFNDGRREFPIPAGHGLFTTNVEASAYYYPPGGREPWSFGWMDIKGAGDSWKWLRQNFSSVISLSPSGRAISLFKDIAARHDQLGFRDRFHSSELVFQFLMEVFREKTSSRQEGSPIHFAQHYIDDHYHRSLGIKELSDKVGMSREHFSRLFTTTVGQSPGAYLRERRLQTAELLLKQSNESINTISRLSGFMSPSHFCRAFRARRGCSPKSFRQRRVA